MLLTSLNGDFTSVCYLDSVVAAVLLILHVNGFTLQLVYNCSCARMCSFLHRCRYSFSVVAHRFQRRCNPLLMSILPTMNFQSADVIIWHQVRLSLSSMPQFTIHLIHLHASGCTLAYPCIADVAPMSYSARRQFARVCCICDWVKFDGDIIHTLLLRK